MKSRLSPTLNLLNASTVVAISGGFRLHIAFLLAGLAAKTSIYIAGILIIYATYTLDRTIDCTEDAINRAESCGADRIYGYLACCVAFFIGLAIFASDGIYLAPFFPFVIGYLYTHGIRIGSFRFKLKGGTGVKNIVTGVTWGGTIALIVCRWCGGIPTIGVIFLFFGVKTFVTSCINDLKDVDGDVAAGIVTLPACLGEFTTKCLLLVLLVVLHGIMLYCVVFGIIQNEWMLLVIGLAILVPFLVVYTPDFERKDSIVYRKMREIAISWESPISLVSSYAYTTLL